MPKTKKSTPVKPNNEPKLTPAKVGRPSKAAKGEIVKAEPFVFADPERQKVVESFNDDLRGVYEDAQKLLANEAECVLRSRYDIGKLVVSVTAAEKTYGAKAVERLSTALDVNAHILYRCKKFAEMYDEDDLAGLIAARGADGKGILWTHMESLVSVVNDEIRNDLLKMTLRQGLTTDALAKKVQDALGGPRGNSTGRPLAQPRNFDGHLDSIITTAASWMKKMETVWLGGETNLIDTASKVNKPDELVMQKLADAFDKVTDANFATGQMLEKLDKIRVEFTELLEEQDKVAVKNKRAYKKDEVDIDEPEPDEDDDEGDDDDEGEESGGGEVQGVEGEEPEGEESEGKEVGGEAGDELEDLEDDDEEDFDDEDEEAEQVTVQKVKGRPGRPLRK